jgi:hypothetical protein
MGKLSEESRYEIWACDFLQTFNVWFRTLFVFFIIELGSRRVVHFAVASSPNDAWVAQQVREATPYDTRPQFLIRDNDRKYGAEFARGRASSKSYERPFARPKPMRYANAFWGLFGATVWITSLSSTSVISAGSSRSMSSISTRSDLIKASLGKSQYRRRSLTINHQAAKLLPCLFSVDCIINTDELPEALFLPQIR